jgi:hypothetical protein
MLYIGRHPGTRYGTEAAQCKSVGAAWNSTTKRRRSIRKPSCSHWINSARQWMNKVIAKLRGYVHQNLAAQKQHELDFGGVNVQPGKIGPNGLH